MTPMKHTHTKHLPRTIIAVLGLGLALGACNRGPSAEASATRAPGDRASNDDDDVNETEPTLVGTVTVLEPVGDGEANEDGETAPRYTSVEYMVAPTLLAACGMNKPTVYFETDSAEVRPTAEVGLDVVASCLRKHPLEDDPIEIVGHADERGPTEYNRELGLDRANTVADALASAGIDRSRIETYSRGEFKADDPDYWDDRRVVIRLAK